MFAGDIKLSGKKRDVLGKKVKKLRRLGNLPANIFGDVEQSQAIVVNSRDFDKVYQEAGDTSVISLNLEGEKNTRPVLVDSVDYHPLKQTVVHVAFRQVNLREKISTEVPIELVGELNIKEATALLLRETIEVEALPNDLPESFEIDLSTFTEIGQEVTIAQLPYDHQKVEIIEEDTNQIILQIQELKQMAEVVEETPVEIEITVGSGESKAEEESQEKEVSQEDKKE